MKSVLFWPWTMPAKAQYWRSTKTPECSRTLSRNRAWRPLKPNAATASMRSAFDSSMVQLGAVR